MSFIFHRSAQWCKWMVLRIMHIPGSHGYDRVSWPCPLSFRGNLALDDPGPDDSQVPR
jgi:hypothetical protein